MNRRFLELAGKRPEPVFRDMDGTFTDRNGRLPQSGDATK